MIVTVTVTVTQAHIDKGSPCEACDCPVFWAILDAIPGLDPADVAVGPDEVNLAFDVTVSLPEDARHWLDVYDSGRGVRPFSFDLGVPDDLMRAVACG